VGNSILLGIGIVVSIAIVIIGIGMWPSKCVKTTDDYYLGGRRLGSIVTIK